MTEKTLPEIYREAADLVLAEGKVEGWYAKTNDAQDECFGYCTMGAVFRVSGDMTDDYTIATPFDGSAAQTRLIKPIADQIIASGRGTAVQEIDENQNAWCVVQVWNDRNGSSEKPTAEDVAALLRETADAVENKEVSA